MHPHRYRICIGGGPSTAICEAFEGFTICFDGTYTTLVADLDQAALHGALLRSRHLISTSSSSQKIRRRSLDR